MVTLSDTHRPVLIDGAQDLWVVRGPQFQTVGLDYEAAKAVLSQIGWADWEISLAMETESIEEFIRSTEEVAR